jgi:hypothetical protein
VICHSLITQTGRKTVPCEARHVWLWDKSATTASQTHLPAVSLVQAAVSKAGKVGRMYKCNTEARSRNHCCSCKAIRITYSECDFVASVTKHAKGTRQIILSSVFCPAVPYFSTLFHKSPDFREKKFTQNKICFDFLCNLLLKYFLF